jgi:hypothetical protein
MILYKSTPTTRVLYFLFPPNLEISQFLHPNVNPFEKSSEEIQIYFPPSQNMTPLEFFKLILTLGFLGKPYAC